MKKTAEQQQHQEDIRDALIGQIISESKSIGTDATVKSAHVGGLVIKYLGDAKGKERTAQKKVIQGELDREKLDTNLTRVVQVYCLVQLEPAAAKLPLGVAASLGSLTDWTTEPVRKSNKLAKLVENAVQEKWTAKECRSEVQKAKGKTPAPPKPKEVSLFDAMQAIARADIDDLSTELVNNPQASSILQKVFDEFAASAADEKRTPLKLHGT